MPAAEMAGLAAGSWRSSPDPARRGWACPSRIATRALSAQAGSVRAARYSTVATLRRWGTAHSSQDIAIVVSEMVTNALRHALPGPGDTGPRRPPVRLGLLQQGPWVLCAVADPGTAVPVPRTPGSLAEAGRGLQMICAFSDLWGYTTPSDAGKVVWAMFTARHAPPSPARPGQARPRPGAGNSTLTTGTNTARDGPRAPSRPDGRDSAIPSRARNRCHRPKGIGLPDRRSVRPDPAAPVAGWCAPGYRCPRHSHALRRRRRYHRGDAAEPGGNPSSTGHVWITIWRRYGRDPFRIFCHPACQRHLSW